MFMHVPSSCMTFLKGKKSVCCVIECTTTLLFYSHVSVPYKSTGNFVTVKEIQGASFLIHHFKLYLLAHMFLGTNVYYLTSQICKNVPSELVNI
jgi:hypothetical protein